MMPGARLESQTGRLATPKAIEKIAHDFQTKNTLITPGAAGS
jgi:hypothetical protein